MANFLWGANGEEVTPEEIATRKQIAQSLLTQANQTPANYWTQGVSNMVNALMGGFMQGRAMKAERANDDYSQAKMASFSGDGMFGGAGTSVNNPQTNAYIGSDSVMKDQPAGDQSDPFGGSGTDVNHPLVQALLPQGGAPASSAPVSPVASALVTPSTPVKQVAQGGALEAITQDVMDHLKRAESGGRIDAKNPNSSAAGPYQIINATADGIRKNHPELGLTPGWQTDPNQVEIGAKAAAQDNLAALLAKGIHPTEGQFYQSWFTNPRQTSQIAQADQNAPISSILTPEQIRANPFLSNMTVGDFGNWAANKMGQGASSTPAQPVAAAQPAPPVGQEQPPSDPYYTDPGPSLAQISDALNDPHMNQSAKGYASALLQNKLQIQQLRAQYAMRQADPAYRLQMQRNQAEINEANARIAQMGSKQQQQFSMLSPQEAQSMGLDPTKSYQRDVYGKISQIGGSGVNVSVSTGNGGVADATSKAYAEKHGALLAAQEDDAQKTGPTLLNLGKALENLAPQIGPGGAPGFIQNQFGKYMPDGWKPSGQSEREQFQSLVNDFIKQSHVPGEGEQSNADAARLAEMAPNMMNSVEGNIAISKTLQGLAQRKISLGALAGQEGRGEISPKDRAAAVAKLPDPYAPMKQYLAQNKSQPNQAAPQSGTSNPSVSDMINAAKPIAPGVSFRKGG